MADVLGQAGGGEIGWDEMVERMVNLDQQRWEDTHSRMGQNTDRRSWRRKHSEMLGTRHGLEQLRHGVLGQK